MRHSRSLAVVVLAAVVALGCEKKTPQEEAPVAAKAAPETVAPQATIGTPGESVVSEFNRRVLEYLAVRQQLAGTLKKLPDRATPLQIDANQRALGALVAKARADAKQGDVFVPDMQTFVRGLIRRVLAEPDGAKIRASLMDENPMSAKVAVNERYPDTVPLSTMPPDVLAALPKLPKDVEYRFVGNRLILLDVQSHLIVDFVDNTFDIRGAV
jgi:hypothetical protein